MRSLQLREPRPGTRVFAEYRVRVFRRFRVRVEEIAKPPFQVPKILGVRDHMGSWKLILWGFVFGVIYLEVHGTYCIPIVALLIRVL